MDLVLTKQILAIDNLLMNAYGTMYKSAVKHCYYDEYELNFSKMGEMLLAKNLQSDLWSVLDYCCTLVYYWYHKKIPTPSIQRQLSFPCIFDKKLLLSDEWEKDKLKEMLGVVKLDDSKYQKLKGVFHEVQYNGGYPTQENEHFYLLHFLRNRLTHGSLQFEYNCQEQTPVRSVALKQLGMTANVLTTIEIPQFQFPWLRDTKLYRSLLDIHYGCCKFVEKFRDNIIRRLELSQPTFEETVELKLLTKEKKLKLNKSEICYFKLHFKCYGLEGEENFTDTLNEFRACDDW